MKTPYVLKAGDRVRLKHDYVVGHWPADRVDSVYSERGSIVEILDGRAYIKWETYTPLTWERLDHLERPFVSFDVAIKWLLDGGSVRMKGWALDEWLSYIEGRLVFHCSPCPFGLQFIPIDYLNREWELLRRTSV